ncbi:MAG: hypothetical protein CMI63_19395 [Parvularcula sp.]|nr:hypothetical protein [Parvularcula sp.]
MTPFPDDMPGLSKKRLLAFEAARRAADETAAAARKETKGETVAEASTPKRKRARRKVKGAGPDANMAGEERQSWAITEETVEAYYDVVSRIITPRVMAQEARCAGNPAARPRDYRG